MAMPLLVCLSVCILGSIAPILALPPTEAPLVTDRPFMAIWNAPTLQCKILEIPLDTAAFQAVTTTQGDYNQFLTIFYEERLGLYPKVNTRRHKIYRGGVPQNGNLTEHLIKAKGQIDHYIYEDSAPGLAVIDWESWRPLWDLNWGSKRIYQRLSISHALQAAPFLPSKDITKLAKKQFQQAGRRFMERTLSLGISERPSHRWGFYLYPDCYNYNWDQQNFTGQCSAKAQKQNNQLLWLWERSTALYPSIYLHLSLKNSPKATLYVRNRVQEAMRVAALPEHPYTAPIYVYSRPLYRDQSQQFLTLKDLVSTVGESAALGASGVIMWGGSKDYNNKAACTSLSEYLVSTFDPYIANVTAAAKLCSHVLCQGHGRCLRKDYNSGHYLHLNPEHFSIMRSGGRYVAVGLPSAADLQAWDDHFTCQCYAGKSCSPKLEHPTQIKMIWV